MNEDVFFLNKKNQIEIVNAICKAEENTSGEIRIHIEQESEIPENERTIQIFNQLQMFNTKHRNAILLHINIKNKSLSIFGDEAIHKIVSQDFWNKIRDNLLKQFKKNKYKKGLIEAILKIGEILSIFFPLNGKKTNELDNEVSFS